jgi:protein TonB
VDVIAVQRTPLDRKSSPTDSAVPQAAPNSQLDSRSDPPPNGSRPSDSDPTNAASSEPPPITPTLTNPSSLNTVLSTKTSVPAPSPPISIGISGGQLLSKTLPAYPNQARQQRLEGTVILTALVMEDGSLTDIKVIKGSPLLARSAVDAVKTWRYQPFQLDGKPIQGETKITIDFKFPK